MVIDELHYLKVIKTTNDFPLGVEDQLVYSALVFVTRKKNWHPSVEKLVRSTGLDDETGAFPKCG